MTIPFDPGTPDFAGMAGMPKGKKTRRGGRGKHKPADPKSHVAAAQKAIDSGDHQTAKQHAFALVRSLHVKMPKSAAVAAPANATKAPPVDEYALRFEGNRESTSRPLAPDPGLAAQQRLATALRGKKK